MKISVAALAVAVATMAIWVWSQAAAMREIQRTVQQLSAKPSTKVTGASLELQANCSEQARKVFADMGHARNPLAGYENHYNPDMNKCFIHIQNTDTKVDPGTIWTYRNVFDAFEGKEYGTFMATRCSGFGTGARRCPSSICARQAGKSLRPVSGST